MRRSIASGISTSRLLSADLRRKAQHTFLGREWSTESLYLDNFYGGFAPAEMESLFAPVAGKAERYRNFLRYWDARSSQSPLTRMLYADQKTYLVELLMKQDQMSMACSIESRVPFLDHPLVEFAARVPDRLKIRNGVGKYILKEAVAGLVPPELLHRPKMGFPTPLRPWLLEEGARPWLDALTDPDGLLAAYTDRERRSMSCCRVTGICMRDATDRIWRLLNLQGVGRSIPYRQTRPMAQRGAGRLPVKILWLKADFLHPTRAAGRFGRSKC